MFTHIYIKNFEGILNDVSFDFVAKSRNKEKQICLYKTHDGIYINKLIGLLAGNASGKTTVIMALATLGGLFMEPIMTFDYAEEKNAIKKLIMEDAENNIIRQRIEKLNSSMCLEVQHVSKKEEDTCIEVEMYIESGENTGYYKYKLQFNGGTKRITEEKFTYRKTFKGVEKEILNSKDVSESQMYYINRYYNNMINLDGVNKERLKKQHDYIKAFVNHYVNDSGIITAHNIEMQEEFEFLKFYKKEPEVFERIIKIIDPKINKVTMKPDNDDEELLYELKTGGNITRNRLSTGTKRFLNLVIQAIKIIRKNGVLLIDELEANMHKELIFLILRLFVQLDNNATQIIFTTNLPEIFDCINSQEEILFKQDAIYLLNNIDGIVEAKKVSDIRVNDKRLKGDVLISSIFKKDKIIMQPDKEEMKKFLTQLNNMPF